MKKIEPKNYLGEGAVVLETASATRKCVCGELIKKSERHLAVYIGSQHKKRNNFCRSCSYQLLVAEKHRLFNMEIILYGQQGA